MKHLRKLLSVLAALCLLCSLCTVAMADVTIEANYDVTLTVGKNRFTLTEKDTIWVMEFVPEEAGIYNIKLSGNGKLYTVSGSMASGYFYNEALVSSKTFDREITDSYVGSPMLIGVATNNVTSGLTLAIERTGDAGFDMNAVPYTTYQPTATLSKFTKPANTTLTFVDVKESHTAVRDDSGNYHLDTVNGPLLYIDLANAPYISISAAASYGNMKVTIPDEDGIKDADSIEDDEGNLWKKIEFITCINEYYGYTNNQTGLWVNGYTDAGVYPLTDDMVYIMQTCTGFYGWNDINSENYLFKGADETKFAVNTDTAWMFPVCYDAEQLPGGSKNPHQLYGDGQVTVEAGASAYVTVYDKDGLILTVNGAPGFSVDGTADTNGSFSAEVTGNEVTYVLKNTTSAPQSYAFSFGVPVGDPANPESVPGAGDYTAHLESGDPDGYTYNYIATGDGYITVTSDARYAINGTDATGNSTRVDVATGDSVKITVYGEGDVAWKLEVHTHVWAPASCLTPATCACGATTGTPAPHDYTTGEGICLGVNLAEGEECGDNIRVFLTETENTLTVPAGATGYYEGRFSGMNATLTGNNVTVSHDGQTYPVTNSVTFKAVGDMWNPSLFIITNTGSEDATYTLNFKHADGSAMAPELLTEGGNYSATIGNGATDGYYYSYTATADCTVTVTINEATGWQYSLSGSAGQGEGMHWYDDDPVVPSESVELSTGDTLTIMVGTYDPMNPWALPAGSVDWSLTVHTHAWVGEASCAGETACSDCSVTKPALPHSYQNGICSVCGHDVRITLLKTDNLITLAPGETGYYIGFFQGMNTTLTGTYVTISHNGETHTVDGSVTFPTVGDVKNPSLFVITNTGIEEATYRLSMEFPLGAKGNPEVIPQPGTYTATLEAGADGYFYAYTAPADGTVTVTVRADSGWQYSLNNLDASIYKDIHNSSEDPQIPTETITAAEGQHIEIMVSTYDPTTPNTNPAGPVSVTLSFEEGEIDTGDGDNGSGDGDNNGGSGDGNNGSGDGNNGSGDGNNGSGDGNNGSGDGNNGSGDNNTPGDNGGSDNNDGSGNNGGSTGEEDNGGKEPLPPTLGIDLNNDGKSDFPLNNDMFIPMGDKTGVDLNGDGVVDAMMIDLDRDGIFDGIDINFDGAIDLILLAEAPTADNNSGNGDSNGGGSAPGGVSGVGNGESTSPETGDEIALLPFLLAVLAGFACLIVRKKETA